jgi:prepilin-type N-terminal cleavage/methylation domain-containing protein
MNRSNQGVTLLEILIVTAIVASLLAISLPALIQARSSAYDSQALSNLRQLGTATLIFMSDLQTEELPLNLSLLSAYGAKGDVLRAPNTNWPVYDPARDDPTQCPFVGHFPYIRFVDPFSRQASRSELQFFRTLPMFASLHRSKFPRPPAHLRAGHYVCTSFLPFMVDRASFVYVDGSAKSKNISLPNYYFTYAYLCLRGDR